MASAPMTGVCLTKKAIDAAGVLGIAVVPSPHTTAPVPAARAARDRTELKHAVKGADIATVVTDWTLLAALCEGVSHALDDTDARAAARAGLHAGSRRLRCLNWLWDVHGRAIYVKVTGGRIQLFVPFANPGYRNTWAKDALYAVPAADGTPAYVTDDPDVYFADKEDMGVRDAPNLPDDAWWNNAGTLCNWLPDGGPLWGQTYLGHWLHMLTQAAPAIGDAEFIVNKRDGPLVPANPDHHPLTYLWPYCGTDDARKATPDCRAPDDMLPVLSPYSDVTWFADRITPTVDDWEAVTSMAFFPHFGTGRSAAERSAAARPWGERVPKAFFRGSATGCGVTAATNPRLALVGAVQTSPFLTACCDVGITAFSGRDRFCAGVLSFLHPAIKDACGGRATFVPQAEQSAYKFHIYAPGHSGASRMGCCLLSGAVTLFMQAHVSTVAPDTWLTSTVFPRLAYISSTTSSSSQVLPGEDTLGFLVDADASNLEATLRWLGDNDTVAARVAATAEATGAALLSEAGVVGALVAAVSGADTK